MEKCFVAICLSSVAAWGGLCVHLSHGCEAQWSCVGGSLFWSRAYREGKFQVGRSLSVKLSQVKCVGLYFS